MGDADGVWHGSASSPQETEPKLADPGLVIRAEEVVSLSSEPVNASLGVVRSRKLGASHED